MLHYFPLHTTYIHIMNILLTLCLEIVKKHVSILKNKYNLHAAPRLVQDRNSWRVEEKTYYSVGKKLLIINMLYKLRMSLRMMSETYRWHCSLLPPIKLHVIHLKKTCVLFHFNKSLLNLVITIYQRLEWSGLFWRPPTLSGSCPFFKNHFSTLKFKLS